MKMLHMMVGLPRSGKSTTAKELGFPIVNPDSIRMVLHGTPFRADIESMVWAIAHVMVDSLFMCHDHVILDACNHTKKRRDEWRSYKFDRTFYPIDTPKDVCIQRAVDGCWDYLVPVIEKMDSEFEPAGFE